MYSARWSSRLRQGDIFGRVFFPLPKSLRLLSAETTLSLEAGRPEAQYAVVQGSPRYAVVLSHDCEFNEGKRPYFVAGRIQNVPSTHRGEDRLEELRRGNDIAAQADDANPTAIDSFLLEAVEDAFEELQVVTFWGALPLPMRDKAQYLRLKRAEMTHESRTLLRTKLAAFYGRFAEDIPDDRKVDRPGDPASLEWRDEPVPDPDMGRP